MNQSAEPLHFPKLADVPPPCSRTLSIKEYAEFSESLLAWLSLEQIQRQQTLRPAIPRRFRLVTERGAKRMQSAECRMQNAEC